MAFPGWMVQNCLTDDIACPAGYILVTEMKNCVVGCRLFYCVCSTRRLALCSMRHSAVKCTCRNYLFNLATSVYYLLSVGISQLAWRSKAHWLAAFGASMFTKLATLLASGVCASVRAFGYLASLYFARFPWCPIVRAGGVSIWFRDELFSNIFWVMNVESISICTWELGSSSCLWNCTCTNSCFTASLDAGKAS